MTDQELDELTEMMNLIAEASEEIQRLEKEIEELRAAS